MITTSLLGATYIPGRGTHFRVWAPKAGSVQVEVERPGGPFYYLLTPEPDGYHASLIPDVQVGDRYRYQLDGAAACPDPCSRFQPDGPHGPSQVVDPTAFAWTDADWQGLTLDSLVIYELHVGTFTPAGTFDAIIPELPELASLGIKAIELMPVAEFPGRRNWGYDGVDLYAPSSAYGGPEALRRLVDAAHRQGLGVLLDVVYNHFGPDGNYLRAFADEYFTDRHTTPWGDAVNFDGPQSQHVRHFVLQNARYWLEEYHLDGLRLDATHAIVDDSPTHILTQIAQVGHAFPNRRAVVIAEDGRNDVSLIGSRRLLLVPDSRLPSPDSLLDGVWADDFHHALFTYLTGEREGYYADYTGRLEDVGRAIEQGFLYQGQRSPTTGKPRGTPVTDEPARAFVFCTENHDQVGNRALGERLGHLVDQERYLVASAVLLFAPETPLLFQGQEFAASAPFLYFTDHNPELGRLVTGGRRSEFKGFSAFADPARREQIPDPQAESTFLRSKLDLSERERHAAVYQAYKTLLALRRDDPVLRQQDRRTTRARAIGEHLLAIHRWHGAEHRLLLANFGDAPAPLPPLLDRAPSLPPSASWRAIWTSSNGPGAQQADMGGSEISPRSAVILSATPA